MSDKRGTHRPYRNKWFIASRIFDGQDVFVLGNGPSLRDTPLKRLAGKNVIAVNSSAFFKPEIVKVLFFGDARWYWHNKERIQALDCLKITLSRFWVDEDGTRREEPCDNEPGIQTMREKGQSGITLSRDALAWNLTSGGAAVNLAYHFGAKRIILLGFDMKLAADGARNGWPNVNPCSVKFHTQNKNEVWRRVCAAAADCGVQIINATLDTELVEVPRVKLEEVLA